MAGFSHRPSALECRRVLRNTEGRKMWSFTRALEALRKGTVKNGVLGINQEGALAMLGPVGADAKRKSSSSSDTRGKEVEP